MGMRLIEVVHPEVKSPAMTGQGSISAFRRAAPNLGPFIKPLRITSEKW
jgi:hypothetical protein